MRQWLEKETSNLIVMTTVSLNQITDATSTQRTNILKHEY